MKQRNPVAIWIYVFAAAIFWKTSAIATPIFEAGKTTWHGFDRYDFVMDEKTLVITPFKALDGEGDSVRDPEQGQRRCIIVVPKEFAIGNPWSWRGCYWNHQPQTEVELLKRGFCIAYISANEKLRPGKEWDAWYAFLTSHGLSVKPAFIGMSRGGEFAYTWATANPEKVSCIYGDNPYIPAPVLMKLGRLATNNVPLFHVCGSIDPLLGSSSTAAENIYQQFGGRISVMIKEGYGHHPHSLHNPKILADFIERSFKETNSPLPAFVHQNSASVYYYSDTSIYENFPEEGAYITLRGPEFTGCYRCYHVEIPGVDAFTTIIAPKIQAPGNPWVFRAGFLERDALVDQSLLAKGYYIVVGAVPYNYDGPVVAQWNTTYRFLTDLGFSKKPIMEGRGGAAGEVYAWAIENPGSVSCIYAENPIMHSNLAERQPLESLEPLAKANVPIFHVCGNQDPGFIENTVTMEKRYRELGGKMDTMVKEGNEHYSLSPSYPKSAVDFILGHTDQAD